VSADLLQRLIEAGTPIALVAEVAERLAEANAAARILAGRRAADRERKRAAVPRIPRNEAEAAEAAEAAGIGEAGPSPAPAPSFPPDPQTNPTPTHTPGVTSRARGRWHRLPEDWSPSRPLPPATLAKVDQWPPGALDDELAAMRRWAANAKDEAGRGRKLDWDKAWVNWIERRHDERYARAGAGGRSGVADGLSPTTRAALRVFGPAEAGDAEPVSR